MRSVTSIHLSQFARNTPAFPANFVRRPDRRRCIVCRGAVSAGIDLSIALQAFHAYALLCKGSPYVALERSFQREILLRAVH